jgi:hypothetical protein
VITSVCYPMSGLIAHSPQYNLSCLLVVLSQHRPTVCAAINSFLRSLPRSDAVSITLCLLAFLGCWEFLVLPTSLKGKHNSLVSNQILFIYICIYRTFKLNTHIKLTQNRMKFRCRFYTGPMSSLKSTKEFDCPN